MFILFYCFKLFELMLVVLLIESLQTNFKSELNLDHFVLNKNKYDFEKTTVFFFNFIPFIHLVIAQIM